jgi:hypothetical protein
MKKLIAFIGIMLITAIAVGQKKVSPNLRIKSSFAQYQAITGGEAYLIKIKDERYIVSYSPSNSVGLGIDVVNRPVDIYSESGNKITTVPIQYDTYINGFEIKNIPTTYHYYFDAVGKNVGGDRVKYLNGGKIAILLTNIYKENFREYSTLKLIILSPKGNLYEPTQIWEKNDDGSNSHDINSYL